MATVLIDNEAFKITLQIVEDFISKNYDAFIENGPTDDIKLIKWELVIYFKKLEGKKKTIVEYYMIPIYKHIKEQFYYRDYNGRCSYIGTTFNGRDHQYFNTLSIDLEKNILTKTIKIKFICDETYKKNYYGCRGDVIGIYTYLDNFRDLLRRLIGDSGLIYTNHNVRDYYKPEGNIFVDKQINLYDNKFIWLKDIVKKHYNDILINIDPKKATERMKYIKDYVKKVYDITLD